MIRLDYCRYRLQKVKLGLQCKKCKVWPHCNLKPSSLSLSHSDFPTAARIRQEGVCQPASEPFVLFLSPSLSQARSWSTLDWVLSRVAGQFGSFIAHFVEFCHPWRRVVLKIYVVCGLFKQLPVTLCSVYLTIFLSRSFRVWHLQTPSFSQLVYWQPWP